MIKVTVLLENDSIDSNKFLPDHGLSMSIEYNKKNILLDVGAGNLFVHNAKMLNIDLEKIDYSVLTPAHKEHTQGLKYFLEINKTAPVYIMDKVGSKYYIKFSEFKVPIGMKLNKKYFSRITEIKEDTKLGENIFFLKNITHKYTLSTFDKLLYKQEDGQLVRDTFDHEGILVIEDNNELVIFSPCSINGVLNIISTVMEKMPNKKIRSYVGGLHLINIVNHLHENNEYLDKLIEKLKKSNIIFYTGHCTGKYAVDYMNKKLHNRVKEIKTGMVIHV
ncbi:MAG: MBL fold metallo-hydrolase [Fusobacteriaceae bacterium]|jgi:7,8-dihydropterin-6-yl-methyl-4-(beta-D-ribofuranosyl)aminobenzene 5'-phosphate synthase|nr:MBL fold metallo-hydrolase [Fusobacteriaceae bacterium]